MNTAQRVFDLGEEITNEWNTARPKVLLKLDRADLDALWETISKCVDVMLADLAAADNQT